MDVSAVNSICSGTFYDNKVLTKVAMFSDHLVASYHIHT